MKRIFKQAIIISCAILLIVSSVITSFAHSGRTDSSGGHRDNQNKSGLGSYHYHCGGYPAHLHNGGYCPYTDVLPSSVTIKTEKTTLGIGEEVSLDAVVYPSNSCNTYVSWSSSDSSVVSVYDGEITAKSYGTAIITAETFNGKKSTIRVTVKEITADKVSVSGLPDATDYYIGESFDLIATITPDNVDNPSIVWSSSNEEIATVSENGNVNLISEGEVEIKATASNGVLGKVVINVKEKCVESVAIVDDEMKVFLGEKCTINAMVTPDDATYPELTWTVEDPSIISISEDGTLTALSCGETFITATSKNSFSDSILVKVDEIKTESIKIEGAKNVQVGNSISLSAVFTPSNATNQNIKWSVSDPEIASIDANGVLTALKDGTVKVFATSADGMSAECEIKVSSQSGGLIGVVGLAGIGAAIIGIVKKKKKS